MSIFKDENKILNQKKQLPELDDEVVLIQKKISKMTMAELWGPTTLLELLESPCQKKTTMNK